MHQVMTGLPSGTERWPKELLTALAYHETGHAVMAAHHGMTILDMWIGPGRKAHHPQDEGIDGGCLTTMYGTILELRKLVIGEIFVDVAPEAAERLSPVYGKIGRAQFPLEYPPRPEHHPDDCDCEEAQYLRGTWNDLMTGFMHASPFYQLAKRPPRQRPAAFFHDFRLPARNIMCQHATAVHALAERLRDKFHLEAAEIFDIMSANGINASIAQFGGRDHINQPAIDALMKQASEGVDDRAEFLFD